MSSSEYLSTTFIGGWVTILAVAGTLGYQYYSSSQPAAKKEKPAAAPSAAKKPNRAKKQRQEAYSSAAQKSAAEEAPAVVTTTSSQPKKERDEESDNRAFAAQMANVKAGKKFDGKSTSEKKQKQKSVKQSRAVEPVQAKVEDEPAAAPSSNDSANDASSAAASPEVTPADPSGVSDMLEAAPSGPSVLRLTDTDKVKQKTKVAKAPEQVETKKQRQNRKKAEERKLAREEDEKERKILMEKQRRTAREAAGIPAKDGSQFMASVGAKSAWNASVNGSGSKKETIDVQPLDTFESATTDAPAASVAPAKPKDTSAWTSSLPSEEEQLELAKAEDDAWATVPTKGSKKAKKTQSSEDVVPSAPAKEARPAPQPLPVNGNSAKSNNNNSYGSFSALTVKDTAAEDDEDVEETEWDV